MENLSSIDKIESLEEDFFKAILTIDIGSHYNPDVMISQLGISTGLPVYLVYPLLYYAGAETRESPYGPTYDRHSIMDAFKKFLNSWMYRHLDYEEFINSGMLIGVEASPVEKKTLRELIDGKYAISDDTANAMSAINYMEATERPLITITELKNLSGMPEELLKAALRYAEVECLAGEDESEFYRHEVWEAFNKIFRSEIVDFIHPIHTFLFGNSV